jgi:hypothetical protein
VSIAASAGPVPPIIGLPCAEPLSSARITPDPCSAICRPAARVVTKFAVSPAVTGRRKSGVVICTSGMPWTSPRDKRGHLAEGPDRAADLYHDALVLRVEHGLRTLYVDSLEALGALAARTGRPLDAARTLAAADAGRTLLGYARRPADRQGYDEVLAGFAVRPGLRHRLGRGAAR